MRGVCKNNKQVAICSTNVANVTSISVLMTLNRSVITGGVKVLSVLQTPAGASVYARAKELWDFASQQEFISSVAGRSLLLTTL